MTITTEEAEELARGAFGLMDDPPVPDDEIMLGSDFLTNLATALRSLAAERDALRAERNAERNARFKAEAEFSHMQRRIARQRRALAKLYRKRHEKNGRLSSFLAGLTAENARLREALQTARRDAREQVARYHDLMGKMAGSSTELQRRSSWEHQESARDIRSGRDIRMLRETQ